MTTMPKQIRPTQTNDWAEILSHITNCMNLEQFKEVEMRIFQLRRFLHHYYLYLQITISHGLKCTTFNLMRKNM